MLQSSQYKSLSAQQKICLEKNLVMRNQHCVILGGRQQQKTKTFPFVHLIKYALIKIIRATVNVSQSITLSKLAQSSVLSVC